MFLSSFIDMRTGEFISVYPFSAEKPASTGNQRSLNFKVMALRDIKLRTRLSKNMDEMAEGCSIRFLGRRHNLARPRLPKTRS